MNCFSIFLVIVLLYSLFNFRRQEGFSLKFPLKGGIKNMNRRINKARRKIKKKLSESYGNISNKMDVIKIKYL
jgi:uncharacterized protein YicC (UPF0701 family)